MDDLEKIMSRKGFAQFPREAQGLDKYVPIRVMEADLRRPDNDTVGGTAPTKLLGAPDYEPEIARDLMKASKATSPAELPDWIRTDAPRKQDRVYITNYTGNILGDEDTYKDYVKQHEQSHVLSNRALPQDLSQTKHPLYKKVGKNNAENLLHDLKRTMTKNREDILTRYPVLQNSFYAKNPNSSDATLEEIMADLNALEDMYGVDLTKDPAFAPAFWSTKNREMYRSSTGYRRTRMDARDPEPYNPAGYAK